MLYTNSKALGIVASEKKIFFMFPHNSLHVCKTCDVLAAVIFSNKLGREFVILHIEYLVVSDWRILLCFPILP